MSNKVIGIICGSVVAVMVCVYIIVGTFFSSHFFPNTTINGITVSLASAEESRNRIINYANDYSISVVEADGTVEKIKGSELGLDVSDITKIDALLSEQNGFWWIREVFYPRSHTIKNLMKFDSQKLLEVCKNMNCIVRKDQKKEMNAYAKFDGQEFIAVKEIPGTRINVIDLKRYLGKEVRNLSGELNLSSRECYIKPRITMKSPELQNNLENLNSILERKIEYEVGEIIPRNEKAKWITIGKNMQVDFDKDAIREYVTLLAKKYNTKGDPKPLNTSYGVTVTVPGGNYGWQIDEDAEVEEICKNLEANEDIKRDFMYTHEAHSHGAVDYGNSYVEINLSEQHLFLYVDGNQVLDSPFVSGCITEGHATPTGAYRVTYKQKNAVLRGEDYESPVSYWMPFNGGVGMHDATWRSSFGGNIYWSNGSHGCINLPYSVARDIYGYINTGFPVLVYRM